MLARTPCHQASYFLLGNSITGDNMIECMTEKVEGGYSFAMVFYAISSVLMLNMLSRPPPPI